jgi:hypothetical protein
MIVDASRAWNVRACEAWPAIEMGVSDVYMTDDDKIT